MVTMTEDDALKLLEIKKGASLQEITDAYRKAAAKTHPDKGGTTDAFNTVFAAKEKLLQVARENGTAATSSAVLGDREDIKNVIVTSDTFLVSMNEELFREWRKPNMKIMGRLNANNKNKETEMVIDFCSKGTGGSYQAIEKYLRTDVGISSPYHMADRVNAIKMIVEGFREYMRSNGKI